MSVKATQPSPRTAGGVAEVAGGHAPAPGRTGEWMAVSGPSQVGGSWMGAAARKATERATEAEASLSCLKIEVAKAESANQRATAPEWLLEQARAGLQAERDPPRLSLSQLHERLAQLIARKPPRRPATSRRRCASPLTHRLLFL